MSVSIKFPVYWHPKNPPNHRLNLIAETAQGHFEFPYTNGGWSFRKHFIGLAAGWEQVTLDEAIEIDRVTGCDSTKKGDEFVG